MKKERIVVLCLCVMLSGILHMQWIAWAWQRALPSPTQAVRLQKTGMQTDYAKHSRYLIAPRNLATAVACTAWPPLGILYSEALVLGRNLKSLQDDASPRESPSLALRYAGFRR